jgi:hypothetical protein
VVDGIAPFFCQNEPDGGFEVLFHGMPPFRVLPVRPSGLPARAPARVSNFWNCGVRAFMVRVYEMGPYLSRKAVEKSGYARARIAW